MDIVAQAQALAHTSALQAVRSRLLLAAATLHGTAGGFATVDPAQLAHLAHELRAIAISMDVLLPEIVPPAEPSPPALWPITDEGLPQRRPGRPRSVAKD